MTLVVRPTAVAIMIAILLLPEGELFAQQRGTICIDQAVALPLTTAEGNQVRVVVNYDIRINHL